MSNLSENGLSHPLVETWFICWDSGRTEIKSYGSILPTQCMVTPWVEIDYYTSEEDWLAILPLNEIIPKIKELKNLSSFFNKI